jgi:hypothetical protein
MPEGNPLVAQARSQTTGVTGIGILESANDLASGVKDGSWVEGGLNHWALDGPHGAGDVGDVFGPVVDVLVDRGVTRCRHLVAYPSAQRRA